MAYDRYDTRRERGWRGSDDDRGYDRGGRRDERGFFERAGDEIASWFGGEDDDRGRNEGRMGRDRDQERSYGRDYDRDRGNAYRSSDRDWNRGREEERGSRPMNWTSSDRDYRSGWSGQDRDFSARGGLGRSSSDSMSPTGPSFGYGGTYGAGTDRGYGGGGYGSSFGGGDRESDRDYRPMTGDYGRSESPWGRDDYRRTSFAGSSRDNDRHYHAWRQRQLDDLDRDYDQYCRDRQDRFESDFGTWRSQRMEKRQHLGRIREHMDVVGSDGEAVGKVDKVRGDRIILTKSDADDNRHHSIDCSMVETVEGDQIRLTMPAEEAKSRFQSGDSERGMFGSDRDRDRDRDRDSEEGEVNLERSFSGTYTR